MISKKDANSVRKKRHDRMRHTLVGTPEKPRLNVFKSANHIYAQIIDDEKGNTLASSSTLDSEVKAKITKEMTKSEAAKLVGESVGKRALDKGIKVVVFDRGGYIYTGRVEMIATGAREAGLDF